MNTLSTLSALLLDVIFDCGVPAISPSSTLTTLPRLVSLDLPDLIPATSLSLAMCLLTVTLPVSILHSTSHKVCRSSNRGFATPAMYPGNSSRMSMLARLA